MTDARYLPQGPGDLVPGRGSEIVKILVSHGMGPLRVRLTDNVDLEVSFDGGWGRDIGAEWEHVYLRETGPEASLHFVETSDIVQIFDRTKGATLYERASA